MLRVLVMLLICLVFAACRSAVEEEADEKFAAAESALRLGEVEKADEAFHEATLLDPDRPDAWVGRGMTLTKLGEIEGARSHYEEALALYRKNGDSESPRPPEETVRKEIMVLVLLGRAEDAEKLATTFSDSKGDTDERQELLDLIATLRDDFGDMILPPEPEDAPVFDENPATDKRL